jgi:alpha-mannosidase
VLYDDVPFFWEAWDVEVYQTEKVCKMEGLPKFTLEERGPLRVSFKLRPRFRVFHLFTSSDITQLSGYSSMHL